MLYFRALESSSAADINFSSRAILGSMKWLHWDQWKVLAIALPFVFGLIVVKYL